MRRPDLSPPGSTTEPWPPQARKRGRGAHRRLSRPRAEDLALFDDARFPSTGAAAPGTPRGTRDTPPRDAPRTSLEPARGRFRRVRVVAGLCAVASAALLVLGLTGRLPEPDGDLIGPLTGRSAESDARPDDSFPAGAAPGTASAGSAAPAPGAAPQAPPAPVESVPPEPDFDELLAATAEMAPDLTASGELVPVAGLGLPADPDATLLLRYRVDVERGLGVDPEFFAEAVHRTLSDERSWGNGGERSFARVSAGPVDFVVTLASPGTTHEWCAKSGLDTAEQNVSCNSSSTERVMINGWRWARGAPSYGTDIAGYRRMLINHEIGHRIGYGHALCPGDGEPAPVMMQQTKSLTGPSGRTCAANPWPHPDLG